MTWEEYGGWVLWAAVAINVVAAGLSLHYILEIRRFRQEMEASAAEVEDVARRQVEQLAELQQRVNNADPPCLGVASGKTDRCAYS